jgi:TolB-like protein
VREPDGARGCRVTLLSKVGQRKLVQWAVAYAAAAFALVQGVDIFAQRFDWPDAIERGLLIACIVGFFVTLVVAWYHGERGAQKVSGTELLLLALLLAIGGGLLWKFAPSAPAPAVAVASGNPAAVPAPDRTMSASDAKSVAVLPFENLSSNQDNAYFAAGMQDEILTRLAGIHDLKVISRTSTEQYASHPPNLKIVAEQLGVATVLEGSVQRAGDMAHITVQLIDARSDTHLWAQGYDRDMKDIFGVQRDVAGKVAEALRAKLLPAESERLASVSTRNPEAYDLYLRAMAEYQRGNGQGSAAPASMPAAIELFEQALAKDPGFALAAAMQAQARMHLYWWNLAGRSDALLAAARAAAEKALALRPDLGEAHEAMGTYWYWGYRDYPKALAQLELARASMPNSASVELVISSIQRRQGHWHEAIASLERAIDLDPRSGLYLDQLGYVFLCLRRYEEADRLLLRAEQLVAVPAFERMRRARNALIWKGDLTDLRSALATMSQTSDELSRVPAVLYFTLDWLSRDYPAAAKVANDHPGEVWNDGNNIGLPSRLYLARALQASGRTDEAHAHYAALRKQFQAALEAKPDDAESRLGLALANVGLGLDDEAVAAGRKATQVMSLEVDAYTGPGYLIELAKIYVRVGNADQAIATLRQLWSLPYTGQVISPPLLELEPTWDPLRKDPRFKALLSEEPAHG